MYCTKCGKKATEETKRCVCGNTTFTNIPVRGKPVEPDDDTLIGAWKKHIKI